MRTYVVTIVMTKLNNNDLVIDIRVYDAISDNDAIGKAVSRCMENYRPCVIQATNVFLITKDMVM